METAAKEAGSSLDSLMSSFNTRIAELKQLVIARNMYPASSVADLSSIDASLKVMELQVQKIRDRLREETHAIPKAKKLVEAAVRQQKKLNDMAACVPTHFPERAIGMVQEFKELSLEAGKEDRDIESIRFEEPAAPKGRKARASAPIWHISSDELNSLPQYMKGRLTLDKVNAAVNDMAAYADANAQLIAAPRKKLTENTLERALELREIASDEPMKGNYFLLESDIKGPTLKLDNTGKAILTVLRHLGRITERRIGHNRVIVLLRP